MSIGGNRGDETRRFAVASVLLAIGFSMLFMGAGGGGGSGSGGPDNSLTQSCTVGTFQTGTGEANGTLIVQCNSVAWNQITGYPSGCSANQFVIVVGASLTCSAVSWTGLTSFPTGCVAGQFVTTIGVSVTCNSVGWTQLTGFPSACPGGQFVSGVGTTLVCALPDTASTFQCSNGQFVTNVTESASGVLTGICVAPSQEASSTFTCATAGQLLNSVTESSAGVITGVCAFPDWTKIINFPAGCASNQFVLAVGVTLTCSAIPWGALTSFPSGCSANQYVSAVGATLTCSAVGWTQLTGFPSACPAGQHVSTIGSTLTCSAPSWTNLTNFPATCPAGQFVTAVGVTLTCSAASWANLTNFPAACSAGQFVTAVGVTLTCGNPNINFQNNAKTCTDTTLTTVRMAGFKLNYTTVGTGKVIVTVNFEISTPGSIGLNTKWQLAFGTGNAPVCNAAAAGTTVGNQYEVGTFSGTASFEEEGVTAGITTLSASTTYWFDVQISDSSTASWIYSLPQMTVMES